MKKSDFQTIVEAYKDMNHEYDVDIGFIVDEDSIKITVNGREGGFINFDTATLDTFLEEFEDDELDFDLVEISDRLSLYEDTVYIEQLYVQREYRREGLATLLMNKFIDEMHSRGLFQIVLRSSPDSNTIDEDALVRFYEKFGFKVSERSEYGGVLMYKV